MCVCIYRWSGELRSVLPDLILEVMPGQKCHVNTSLILIGYRVTDASRCSLSAHAWIDEYNAICMFRWIDCGLFIYAVSAATGIQHWMIWENGHVLWSRKDWQKAGVLYVKPRSLHSPGVAEKNYSYVKVSGKLVAVPAEIWIWQYQERLPLQWTWCRCLQLKTKLKLNSVALARERTIPTERPPLVGRS
jgi:hypothetical protein